MILLRQKTYATSASFKPKFRKRFRSGDFTYVQAKDPRNEMLNHQAYKEVACEDEFKNNPETYKIRQGLFSDSDDDEEKHKKSLQKSRKREAIAAVAGLASAAAGGGGYLKDVIDNDPAEIVDSLGLEPYERIKRYRKAPDPEIKREEKKLYEKLKKSGNTKIEKAQARGIEWAYDPKNDKIYQPKSSRSALSLSHELGHRHYGVDKDAKKLGKFTHKLRFSKLGKHAPEAGSLVGIAGGAAAGVDKARREEQGKKETAAGKLAPVLGNLSSAPMLHTEAVASKKGIELLKKAGASEKYLKHAKKSLGAAYGSYVAAPAASIAAGYAAKEIAYRREKENLRISKLDPKKQEKEKDKRKLKNANKIIAATAPLAIAGAIPEPGDNMKKLAILAGMQGPMIASLAYKTDLERKLYKKYHPEDKKPSRRDVDDWLINEMGVGWKSKKKKKEFKSNDAIRKKLRGD